MAYTAWSVVFGEQPTAAKWNQLGENDAGFKDGTNIDDLAILERHIDFSTIERETTEKVIGQWIDGRPIYQKVISMGAGPNATSKSVAHGITNLDFMINAYGATYVTGGSVRYLPITISSANLGIIGRIAVSGANLIWETTYNATGETGYLVCEYVKT